MNLEPFCLFAAELAHASGDLIRPLFGRYDVKVELKEDESPVTIADKKAEILMREMIERRFPTHGIIGEEGGATDEKAEWVWVLDPIDGTKSFAANVPLFGTLIALLHQGKPIVGAIHQPILRQLMIGTDEKTTLNGEIVRMREIDSLAESTLLTTDFLRCDRMKGEAWCRLSSQARTVRTWGDCYGYLLLASGWADVMVDPKMALWDVAALIPIVRGAGGKISNWTGGDVETPVENNYSAIAAHPKLHAQIVEILNESDS